MGKLAELKEEIANLTPEQVPDVLGQLEQLKAVAWAQLLTPNGRNPSGIEPPDELVNAREAARRLGLSLDYVYRHARQLPFAVRVGRQLRFSSRGIERYIERRQGK
jgi:excisionase family DNA binding protein